MPQSVTFGPGEFEQLFRQWLALALARLGYGDREALFPQRNIISSYAKDEAALADAAEPGHLFLHLHHLADRDPLLASQLIASWFQALIEAKVLSPRSPFAPKNKGGRPRKQKLAASAAPPGRPRNVTPESDRQLLELIDGVKGRERDQSGALILTDRDAVDWLLANVLPTTAAGNPNPAKRSQMAKTLANRASSARRSRKASGNL
jgi:hypothetical protein